MGIRCYCPNGHVLNVKEQLAGQRGICPKCGLSFTIPPLPEPEVPELPPSRPSPSRPSPAPSPRSRVAPETVSSKTAEPEEDFGAFAIVTESPRRDPATLRKLSKRQARMATTFVLGAVALALIVVLVVVLVMF